jgi:hypothetical protein
MSEADPTYESLRQERLDSYKKVWKWFLWMGWPATLLVLWLGSRIIDGLHARIVALTVEVTSLKTERADR